MVGQVQDLCIKYHLPQPLQLLQKHVLDYWEELLRSEAEDPRFTSFVYFKSKLVSLSTHHPLWPSAGPSPSKVVMASVQAQMVSGCYRNEGLCRNWSIQNTKGNASSPQLEQTLFQDIQAQLNLFTISYCKNILAVISNLSLSLPSNPSFCHFLLDCSIIPAVIRAHQLHGDDVLHHTFNVTHRWIYSLHSWPM